MVEIHDEIIDEMIKQKDDHTTMMSEACKFMGEHKYYSITNYAVICEGKIVCFTGPDVIDAGNLCHFLETKFPGKNFTHSSEFPSIES
jgi:hypothetical protein